MTREELDQWVETLAEVVAELEQTRAALAAQQLETSRTLERLQAGIFFELPDHILAIVDKAINIQEAHAGNRWTRSEMARRWVCEMARMARDRSEYREF